MVLIIAIQNYTNIFKINHLLENNEVVSSLATTNSFIFIQLKVFQAWKLNSNNPI